MTPPHGELLACAYEQEALAALAGDERGLCAVYLLPVSDGEDLGGAALYYRPVSGAYSPAVGDLVAFGALDPRRVNERFYAADEGRLEIVLETLWLPTGPAAQVRRNELVAAGFLTLGTCTLASA